MGNGELKIHFLNVGHGDCTIIEHPSGRISVIDINNGDKIDKNSFDEIKESLNPPAITRQAILGGLAGYAQPQGFLPAPQQGGLASALLGLGQTYYEDYQKIAEAGYGKTLTNPIEYLDNLCQFRGRNKTIFRYIQTHPDMDHMRGLTALLDHGFEIINFWDTDNTKDTPDFRKVFDNDKTDWETYQKLRRGEGAKSLIKNRAEAGVFWNRGDSHGDLGDGIEILSPTPDIARAANANDKHNNHSYVLRITYAGISIILGGDSESEIWDDLVNTYGAGLKCHVLKASHHGRDSGYHQPAVKLMDPELTVVSVGKKPPTDASHKYTNYSGKVLSTRWSGNITLIVRADGSANYEEEYS